MNGKRVGLYLRVSTGEPTVENQREALTAASAHRGWKIAVEFVDNGVSGTKGRDKRPGFDRLLKAATQCKIDVVAALVGRPPRPLVAGSCRLSRRTERGRVRLIPRAPSGRHNNSGRARTVSNAWCLCGIR